MAIKNPDGTPYKLQGEFRQFNPNAPEHDLFNSWYQESLEIGGSPIFYYEIFIPPGVIDPLYWEARGKLFSNNPVQLYGSYEPAPSSNDLTLMGIDAPDEVVFDFSFRAILKAIGHPPKIGSVLKTPHKNEYWEIVQRNAGEFKLWGELRMEIIAKRYQDSPTTTGKIAPTIPDFKING